MSTIGQRRHRIRVESPTTVLASGGYVETWTPVTPGTVAASIEPATAHSLEQFGANTVTSMASHVVEMNYLDGVTTGTRLTFGARVLNVVGVQNPSERNITLVLACVERLS